jgi:2-polyprenyl-3-methyl-5-hydroxy-6-metoxy-1,4-benzoquinol methylase
MSHNGRWLDVWGLHVAEDWLSDEELQYVTKLPRDRPEVQWLWAEMDRVWHEQNLDNRRSLSSQSIGPYYGHPVWLTNGLFTASDPESIGHRHAIAAYLCGFRPKHVADFGGGFGSLARVLVRTLAETRVDVVEPFPSRVGMALTDSNKVSFKRELHGPYDAIVAQDVLEHVDDPVGLAIELASSTKQGGHLVFANCFEPHIECHLPQTFFLRHTFSFVLKGLGLTYLGSVPGAAHAQVFRRDRNLRPNGCRRMESLSRVAGPFLNKQTSFVAHVRRLMRS